MSAKVAFGAPMACKVMAAWLGHPSSAAMVAVSFGLQALASMSVDGASSSPMGSFMAVVRVDQTKKWWYNKYHPKVGDKSGWILAQNVK